MKTAYKISTAVIVLLVLALISAPAFAQTGYGLGGGCGGCGGGLGGGYGAMGLGGGYGGMGLGGGCGGCGGVAYGPPQDCIAQVYCNVPVTTEVPTMTTTCVPQEVPIVVPVQSSMPVTVPQVVVVPQTCEVPYMTATVSSTTVPVTVPVQTCTPVTSLVPQSYTVPLGCGGGAPPAGGASSCSCA